MDEFMVVATFREGTDMREVFAVVAEEQARVAELVREGRLGQVFLSLARGTVFLTVTANDDEGALATVRSLPMAKWWDLDSYPLNAPANPEPGA
jgi:muconolactone delta-isomerase